MIVEDANCVQYRIEVGLDDAGYELLHDLVQENLDGVEPIIKSLEE